MPTNFLVKICDNNPYRWYVSFNRTKPFSLRTIKHNLERNSYQTLASTPTVMVFRSESVRLTWNSHGLVQMDFSDRQVRKITIVEKFVKELLELVSPDNNLTEFSE